MKLKVILLGLLFVSSSLFGQSEDKKGFIGLNIGTSYLLNKEPDNAGVGANLNLINFGFEFKKKFGIAVKWMGGAHVLSKDNQVGYGAILVGPMYTLKLTEKVLLDVKFQPGLFWVIEEYKGISNDPGVISEGKFRTMSLTGFSTGLSLRHNFAKRWSWMTLLDYNNGLAPGTLVSSGRLHALSLNLGIGVRI